MSPTFRKVVLIGYLLFFGALLIFGGYRNRCRFLPCQPASWTTIYAIAQEQAAKSGANYRIEDVRAELDSGTSFTDQGPQDVRVRVTLVPIQLDPNKYTSYPEYWIEFNDRDQWIERREVQVSGSENEVLHAQEWLERVNVSPRDVYRLTWALAQRELVTPLHVSTASASLYSPDFVEERFRIESAWVITYSSENDRITYWIDAQTGEIVAQER